MVCTGAVLLDFMSVVKSGRMRCNAAHMGAMRSEYKDEAVQK
jgi:hypothetical protein